MPNVACPHCASLLIDDGSLAGQVVECPRCRKDLTMPGPQVSPGPVINVTPRTTSRRPSSAETSPGIILLAWIGGGGLIVAVLAALWFGANYSTPRIAMARIQSAFSSGDYGYAYDNLSARTQARMDLIMSFLEGFATQGKPSGLTGRELFVRLCKSNAKFRKSNSFTLLRERVKGSRAEIVVRNGEGKEETLYMVWENGAWRIDFPDTPPMT